jgi:diguanylate cyclase (GGDEF)-like protein
MSIGARWWCAVILVLAAFAASAQQPSVIVQAKALYDRDHDAGKRFADEALRAARARGDNVAVAEALVAQCWCAIEQPENSLRIAAEGLALTARTGDRAHHARLLSCRGSAMEGTGRINEAAGDYLAARAEAERAGERGVVADTWVQQGYVLYWRGDLNEALVSLQKGYEIAGAVHDEKLRRTALTNIAHVYADPTVAQYDKAIEYYRQILAEYEALGTRDSIADIRFDIGSTFERKGDLQAALVWYRRALDAEQKNGRNDEAAYVKRSIAVTLSKLGRSREAIPLFNSALQTFVDLDDADRTAQVRQSRGIAYRRMGRFNEAIADLEESAAYFRSQNNARFLEKSQDELALSYAGAQRWREAFEARSADAALQRELAEKLREERTSRLRVQFDSEKKEQENRALQRENALRVRSLEAAARISRQQNVILGLSAFMILVLLYLIVRRIQDAKRMRVRSLTDDLTRLANRRRMIEEGETLLHRTLTGGPPFSVIAFDIDHFKQFNDTHGHAAGDTVLQRVAHACRIAVRPTDIIGRTGGEEFTVFLPNTHLREAQQVAERLRAATAAIPIGDFTPTLPLTISLGVAEWSPADTTLPKILGRADAVLYRAKEAGRDRVEVG